MTPGSLGLQARNRKLSLGWLTDGPERAALETLAGRLETDLGTDGIAIGQRVEVTFVPTDGGPPVPMFKPVTR